MAHTRNSTTGIAIAIVAAGALIAFALFFSGQGARGLPANAGGGHGGTTASASDFRLPSAEDHVRGNPDATVTLIEFSDLECPFCAQLHPTLKRIVEERDGVNWVYRHFPLSTIHSSARSAAIASECIAELAGNDAFWTFTDAAFQNQRLLGASWYREQAVGFGIERAAFEGCIGNRSTASNVDIDYNEAIASGGRGTPHVVIVTASGELRPFSGALPYAQISALVDQALAN